MSYLRSVRLLGALLAVAAVSALAIAGFATAQSQAHHATKAGHAAKSSATGCAAPGPGVSGGPPRSSYGSAAVGARAIPGSFSHPGTEQCPPAPGSPAGAAHAN